MTRHAHHRTKAMHPHMRRKLSEEGKRLLRHALSHDDGDREDAASLDLSVVSNRGDTAADSDLDGFPEWQEGGNSKATARRRANKLKIQYGGDENDSDGQPPHGDGDMLDDALEQLAEKRETRKVQALDALLQLLGPRALAGDRLHAAKATLTAQLLATLKKRALASSARALRVLAVLAIALGPDEQTFFESVCAPLARLVDDPVADEALRVEAAYALSIASYVCCREGAQRWDVLDALGARLVAAQDTDGDGDGDDAFAEPLLVALVECWAFLVSGFHPSVVVPAIREAGGALFDHVEALAGFLREDANPVVRARACEALALLVQNKYVVGKSLWNYAMEDPTSPLGGLESKLARYMHQSAKSVGKKTRKLQRSMLKEVLHTLRTGEGPHEELRVGDETLALSTWSRFFQASVFRRALQAGFQVHLHRNAVLRDVFDIADNTNAKISMISTVRRRSDLRVKTLHKRHDMSRKAAHQNAFLYDE